MHHTHTTIFYHIWACSVLHGLGMADHIWSQVRTISLKTMLVTESINCFKKLRLGSGDISFALPKSSSLSEISIFGFFTVAETPISDKPGTSIFTLHKTNNSIITAKERKLYWRRWRTSVQKQCPPISWGEFLNSIQSLTVASRIVKQHWRVDKADGQNRAESSLNNLFAQNIDLQVIWCIQEPSRIVIRPRMLLADNVMHRRHCSQKPTAHHPPSHQCQYLDSENTKHHVSSTKSRTATCWFQ